ncbi:MAG: helix-turn-helix domain-containing protein [Cyanobacteria bacterium]|nr:helix-turn-helix domain-containing protein [Cyanobacteriota bacterium]
MNPGLSSENTVSARDTRDPFIYTTAYLTEFLAVSEDDLNFLVAQLGLNPFFDERTGATQYSKEDLELLKKAVEMQGRGETMSTIQNYLLDESLSGNNPLDASESATIQGFNQMVSAINQSSGISNAVAKTGADKPAPIPSGERISVVVEAMTQAKEGILKDMARLLDDKLAGLDEVVVELIRCKSENDSLKQRLKAMTDENSYLQSELSRFKPVQFGFYRKN